MRKFLKWGTLGVLTLAVLCYLLLLGGLWAVQERLMFGRSSKEIQELPDTRGWAYEDVWCDVDGEKTHGWWIPLEHARGTVLFSHGSGRNVSGYLDDVALFRELGMSVLLYDYGGYGQSTGEASEERCYADARAMWKYLVETRGIAPRQIILDGSSMGGGVTAQLATEVDAAAVILESTFTSVPETLSDTYPFVPAKWICHIQFRNVDKVGRIKCPVLILHSRQDTVIPFEHSQRLLEKVAAPKMFVEIRGAHHGGKFDSRETYLQGLGTFVEEKVQIPLS